jgi:hypothetical protein
MYEGYIHDYSIGGLHNDMEEGYIQGIVVRILGQI